uniref:RRM domain-containing protein n=1 Tax=Arcella intermedia TaxID=1963864 RepID=A0A6B2LIN9_9EUKA
MPPQTTQESLASYLSQYGNITECKVVMDVNTGRSKGYGFVVYATPQEAQVATAEGYLTVDGKRCNCNLASVGVKKDGTAVAPPTKKRAYSEQGAPADYGYAGEGYPDYSAYAGYDKRQRTEPLGMAMGYSMPPVAPGLDLVQMHLNSSLTAMYTDIQSIKYEMGAMSQNLNSLKTTLASIKAGVDSLCARQGLVVPPSNYQ